MFKLLSFVASLGPKTCIQHILVGVQLGGGYYDDRNRIQNMNITVVLVYTRPWYCVGIRCHFMIWLPHIRLVSYMYIFLYRDDLLIMFGLHNIKIYQIKICFR